MSKSGYARVIPGIRYRDAHAAIDWLCEAFGFERHLVVPGPDGTVPHAQLRFGNSMIMLGSALDDSFGQVVRPPDGPDGANTQSSYVVVDDADAHHARAVAAGARVILPLVDQDYGGRGYTCRDLEGHVWSFGTYDPWA